MANLGNFDPSAHEEMQDFTPLPAGEYLAHVVSSEVKSNSSNTGELLTLEWYILDGEYTGRRVFAHYNLSHSNPKAAEIGQRELAAACRAMGLGAVQDSEQMHAIPCIITLKIRPAKGSYGPSNDVKKYAPVGAMTTQTHGTPTAAAQIAPQQIAPQQNTGKPVWQQ